MKKGLLFALGLVCASAAWGEGKITLTTDAPVGTVVKFLPNVVSATQPLKIDWGNGVIVNETVDPKASAWQRWVEGTVEGETITITGNLTELTFQDAQLTSAVVEDVANLTSITLSNNALTSFELSGPSALNSVDLSYNQLVNSPSVNPTLGLEACASSLTSLNVSHNTGLQCLKVDDLVNLVYLTANDCPEMVSIFICLPEVAQTTLRNINLDNCNLAHFYPVSMPALRVLSLANNNLVSGQNDYDPFVMGDYPELVNFDISGNSGIEEIDITACTKLEQFRANSCNLSRLDVAQCPSLLTLGLRYNNITTLDLGNNLALKNVYLTGNPIREFDAARFPYLTSLDIADTQISRVDLMKAFYLTDFNGAGSQLEWVDFGGQQPNRLTKVDLRNCTSFTQESMNYTLHTLPQAKRSYSTNLFLEGSPYEHAGFDWVMDTDMNWIIDVDEGDGTAVNSKVNVTVKDATLTGNRITGVLDRLYPNMGLSLSYDLDECQTEGGKFLLPQWQPPYFQTIKSVTNEALIGVPMYVYVYPEEGYEFKSVTVNGKEIKSQWFMISEAAEIKVNFAEIGAEPSVAFTVPQGQKMSFLVNTASNNGTIAVDWGTGTRTEYPGQTAYTPGTYRIGGSRIDGTAAGTTVTIYGDLAAVDVSGFGDVAADYGLWDNAISAVDLSNADGLRFLNIYWNPVTSLDLSGCPDLEILNASYTAMTSLDLSHTPGLLWLSAYSDGWDEEDGSIRALTSLDITMLPRLQYIDVKNNKLSAIDLSGSPWLRWANFNGNELTAIDLSGCPYLEELDVSRNSLAALDVTANTALTSLSAENNNLTSLDVSANTALETLMVGNNAIKALDTSVLAGLQYLYINGNGMSADELNDLYYKLPRRIAKDEEDPNRPTWNLAVIQALDKEENDGRRADSSIAIDREWSPSHTGSNGGSDFAYLDILPTSHGTFKVTDAQGNEYAHGSKVPKYTELTIEAVPAEGYEFKYYSLNGEEPVYTPSFTMPGIYTKLAVGFGKAGAIDDVAAAGASVMTTRSTIVVKADDTVTVEVFNAAGACVASGDVTGAASYTVAPGVYLVRVTSADGRTATVPVAVR